MYITHVVKIDSWLIFGLFFRSTAAASGYDSCIVCFFLRKKWPCHCHYRWVAKRGAPQGFSRKRRPSSPGSQLAYISKKKVFLLSCLHSPHQKSHRKKVVPLKICWILILPDLSKSWQEIPRCAKSIWFFQKVAAAKISVQKPLSGSNLRIRAFHLGNFGGFVAGAIFWVVQKSLVGPSTGLDGW